MRSRFTSGYLSFLNLELVFVCTWNLTFSILIYLSLVEMKISLTPRSLSTTPRYERDDSSRHRREHRYDRSETPRSRQRNTYDERDRYQGRESYRQANRDYHGEKRGRYNSDRRTPGIQKIVEAHNDINLFIIIGINVN